MRKIVPVLVSFLLVSLFSCDMGGINKEGGPVPEPDTVVIPEDFLGLCHAGYEQFDNSTKTALEYGFIKYLGAKWTLMDITWTTVEPTDDAWNFAYYDNIINRANAEGVKVFAVMAYGNDVITGVTPGPEHPKPDTYVPPDKYSEYAEYLSKAIEYYGGRVAGYSIWNEPNENPRFWTGTAKEMWDLTAVAGAAARPALNRYNPGGKLIGGVLNILAPDIWTRGFFVSGAMAQTDAIAFHPYMPNGNNAYLVTKSFNDVTARYGFADKVWITEMGFPTGGRYSSCVEEDRMPEEVVKTIVLLATGGAARHIFWYQLFDGLNNTNRPRPENSEDWFGLAYFQPAAPNLLSIPDNSTGITKKKGADAYALCAKYISGTTYRRLPIVSGLSDVESYYFEGENGARTLVLWSTKIDATATTPVRVNLPGSGWRQYNLEGAGTWTSGFSAADLGQDLPSGNNVFPLGKTPLFLTWTAESGLPGVTAP